VLLGDQDRRLWDRLLIRRGLASLARAESLSGPIGPYTLQAGIAACHARADSVESTDWARIVSLYDVLTRLWDSPVVDLNRAVAVGMADGPAAGLAAAQAAISTSDSMRDYPHAHLVVGDMLSRLGRSDEAQAAFDRAADLTQNEQQRALFSRLADEKR
jgi:predicted RNA polymerase sigma factor